MKNLFVLALLIFSFSFTSTTAKAQAPQVGKTYYIESAMSSSRYLASKSGGQSPRTPIVIDQKTARNKTAMQWKFQYAGQGYYAFIHSGGQALDVKGGGTVRKTPLWLSPKRYSDAQKFRLQPAGGGYYYIVPKLNPSLCLDVQGANTAVGTPIWIFNRNGTNAQKWRFTEIPPSNSGSGTGNHVEIPKNRIAGFASLIMDGIRLRMNNFGPRYRDRNDNVSWYNVDDSYFRLGNTTTRFNIPMYVRGIRDKTVYFHGMNLISSATTTSFEGNRLVVTLKFEENGTELKGMCPGCAKFREDSAVADSQISDHTWKIYLKLIPYNRSIAFEVTDVRFSGTVSRVVSGSESAPIQEVLVPAIKSEITKAFQSQRSYIAQEMKRRTTAAGYRFDNVASVYTSGRHVGILTR
ncbi:MAG: RICIN domain-containing protein [Chitinophagales bacterium]